MGINRTYLSRIALLAIGGPLGDALRKRQLRFARKLLRKTALTVAEVAALAAFGTERTLYRAFLRDCGITPGQYRDQSR